MASVKICDGRTVLYQWDTGVRLEMCGCSRVTECHFVTSEGVIKRDVVDNICAVPDAALKQAGKLIVYAFSRTEDEGTTRHEFRLAVYSRPKPADYIDPPDEYDNLEALAERIAPLIPDGGGGGIVQESDPTVPDWAKQKKKPTYTAEEVGALSADAEIIDTTARNGMAANAKAVAALSEDKDKLSQIALLMYQLLGAAAYDSDVSEIMSQLDDIYGNGGDVPDVPDVPDEPDEPDEPTGEYLEFDVIVGTILQKDGSYIKYRNSVDSPANATLNPFAFYATTGNRYVFSLGGASGYMFGVRTFTISDTNLSFDVPDTSKDVAHSLNNTKVTETGWVTADTTIVEDGTFNLFAVTFKRKDGANITDADLATLNEQFTIKVEEVQ